MGFIFLGSLFRDKKSNLSSNFSEITWFAYLGVEIFLFNLIFLFEICTQSNTGISGCSSFSDAQRRRSVPFRVVCLAPSNSSGSDRNNSLVMEAVAESHNNPTVAGGVRDVYGEDKATEDHLVTPRSVSVARWE